jgi:hypothetical protein
MNVFLDVLNENDYHLGMQLNYKLKYHIKTLTYIFLGGLLPGISIANTSEKKIYIIKKLN